MRRSASGRALGTRTPAAAGWRRAVDIAAVAAAVALLAATAASLAGRVWWGFELLSHFRLQYVAAAIPLCAVLVAVRRPRWCAAVALAAVPNVLPVLPYLTSSGAAHATGVPAPGRVAVNETLIEPLRVMAVNVEWRNASAERLLSTIETESPDVVVVVELNAAWVERLRPLHEEYPHRLLVPADGAFGIGLFSRRPLAGARALSLAGAPAIDARIAAPGGALRLVGVHLRPPTTAAGAAERNRQLDALAKIADDTDAPLAVCGDFNLTPYSPVFADWAARTGLRDARAGSGLGMSWPTFLPILGIPIDHCVLSAQVGVTAFRRLPAFGSDHYPIAVELFLEDER